MKKICITGANGFIGKSICKALSASGNYIRGFVRTIDLENVSSEIEHVPIGDISLKINWKDQLKGFDCIIHCAGITQNISSIKNQDFYHLVNVDVTKRLAEQAAEAGVKRLIFLSSVKVYGESIDKTNIKKKFFYDDIPTPIDDYGISKLKAEKEDGAIYHDNIKSLFSVSDVLSICCPATKETENMINKETVEYFPKGAIITNVARGDIIEDEALIDALNRRKIYAVGLDVYKNEPNLNSGYLKIKTAFILPHLGSATKDTRIAMANLAIDNIEEFFKTGNCINKVN